MTNEPLMTYHVAAIVQNEHDDKPWLCSLQDSCININEATQQVKTLKTQHTVLSIWIDRYDETNTKHTVFHECYINIFGQIRQK